MYGLRLQLCQLHQQHCLHRLQQRILPQQRRVHSMLRWLHDMPRGRVFSLREWQVL